MDTKLANLALAYPKLELYFSLIFPTRRSVEATLLCAPGLELPMDAVRLCMSANYMYLYSGTKRMGPFPTA